MNEKNQSIAIIGSGITGMSASWLLHKKYNITLFEKNNYLGGHTHTHDVVEDDSELAIDSGFIVYNEKNYPNLVGLFDHLAVKTQATDMSFAFSMNQGELEYAGSGLKGMFAQRGNLVRIKHWRLIQEIVRFNKTAHAELPLLEKDKSSELSLGDFLKQHKFSKDLKQNYLLPMGAAIWSCPVEIMNSFPAYSFLRFFANHGLIDLQNRPQWRSVVGGSREYIRKMMPTLSTEISIKGGAQSVRRTIENDKGIVEVISDGISHYFDQVIFACHADEALKLIDQPSAAELDILTCFKYQENITYLHTDESLMPKRKNAWCSWNYLAESGNGLTNDSVDSAEENKVTATYWMNNLQKLDAEKNYLVTLNPYQQLDQNKVIKKMTYHHPVFDRDAIYAQSRLNELQGENNSWFCGSYTGYGFHEDALSSSVDVCEKLGVIAPWNELTAKPGKKVRELSMSSAVSLYACDVMHRRHFPQNYRFDYKVFSFLIDIDEFQQNNVNPLLSINRFNLYSVYTKDHGSRDGSDWRTWIDSVLDQHNLGNAKHQIKLLCFPRILGYAFNPLSLWYCFGEDGQLYAVVCEVSNTFGEHHHYVLHNDNQPYKGRVKAHKKKHFHVSPFISMDAEYRFTIGSPGDDLLIVINEYQDNELMLTATQVGEQQDITTPHLLGQFFRLPLMTFKIMWLIHWQALKIWMRGGVFHKKPQAPKEDFS